ncbi:MAG: chemotaxis protein CheA [Deltaproteobacteria bacterium]|nr:chemotaxis protein CheA [Deltaproteobacteria bacterium]
MKEGIKGERYKEFIAEAEELLASLGKGLFDLERDFKAGHFSHTLLNRIFRAAHSLKGISGIFDFKEFTKISHLLEDTLDSIRLGKTVLTSDTFEGIMRLYEMLHRIAISNDCTDFKAELKAVGAFLKKADGQGRGKRKDDHVDPDLLAILTDYEKHRLSECIKADKMIYTVQAVVQAAAFDSGYEALISGIEDVCELIATVPSKEGQSGDTINIELLVASTRNSVGLFEHMRQMPASVVSVVSPLAIRRHADTTWSRYHRAVNALKPGESQYSLRSQTSTVRVNIAKLDSLMDIVGDLALLKTNIARLVSDMERQTIAGENMIGLKKFTAHLERKLEELRKAVLDARMVPIGRLFSRFESFIARLSRDTDKEIKMATFGEETEIDKLMVEELADPLMHIVKNVVDHAIEHPSERKARGKPSWGTITFCAYYKANHAVVEVRDDGAGIDEEAVMARALERGLISKEEAQGLMGHEILDLIFVPGFTTTERISELSGRGVGLDVVKENISRMSGVIDIETVKGKGTRFIMTIPVTLAIVEAIIVEDNHRRYALPLNSVLEVVSITPGLIGSKDGIEVITKRDKSVPVVRLSSFMEGGFKSNGAAHFGIVAGIAEHRVCILVDRIIEDLDIVVKPISSLLKVPWVAGAADAAVADDGAVLVLDVSGVLDTVLKTKKYQFVEGIH